MTCISNAAEDDNYIYRRYQIDGTVSRCGRSIVAEECLRFKHSRGLIHSATPRLRTSLSMFSLPKTCKTDMN